MRIKYHQSEISLGLNELNFYKKKSNHKYNLSSSKIDIQSKYIERKFQPLDNERRNKKRTKRKKNHFKKEDIKLR